MPVSTELTLTEVRVKELYEIVDVFVICEGNASVGGKPKPLMFFKEFQKGFLQSYQDKILHVFHYWGFPEGAVADGWAADEYARTAMSQEALRRIKGLK